ncbi:MAG: helix-turn-helix domain-containing protein [Bacilli bacterium]|jgi:transcriptional regulator with XRE-family HTH domain
MSDLENKKVFSENLKYYMKLYNKDRNSICKDLNFKYTTVRDWVKGRTYPRIEKIEMLANYFRVQKSDLIEEKTKDVEKKELQQLATVMRKLGFLGENEEDSSDEEMANFLKWYKANKDFIRNKK